MCTRIIWFWVHGAIHKIITSNYFIMYIYIETLIILKTIQADCSMIMYLTDMLKIKTVIIIKKIFNKKY